MNYFMHVHKTRCLFCYSSTTTNDTSATVAGSDDFSLWNAMAHHSPGAIVYSPE